MNFTLTQILIFLLVLNAFLAIITVFWSKREVSTIWAWLLVLTLLPGIGFIVFWFFGRRISDKQIFDLTSQELVGQEQIVNNQKRINEAKKELNTDQLKISKLIQNSDESILTVGNNSELMFHSKEFFDNLINDLKAAKETINFEFFTIFDDGIGNEIVDILETKQKAGVEVRVIFDQFGSRGKNKKLYKRLIAAGGKVYPFLMRPFQLLTLRINFRLHRKIVVIDGKIGYIGGFNIGDMYLGKDEKMGKWRDTHTRLIGDIVLSLQSRFFSDWNATSKKEDRLEFSEKFFPTSKISGLVSAQAITSGPDSDDQKIKHTYMEMFSSAKKKIFIQTPYFVPDLAVFETLQNALKAGVEVNLMIPNKPDHIFVYRATEYYANELAQLGAKVFVYNDGFLHTKVVSIDGNTTSIGSANMDIRSFDLNFEAITVLFSNGIAAKMEEQFKKDVSKSIKATPEYFANQKTTLKILQRFSRLVSPIL